jgi:hypothetical protein
MLVEDVLKSKLYEAFVQAALSMADTSRLNSSLLSKGLFAALWLLS